eukprot:1154322-Pelagomonas_calceolata.AAC.8
MLLHSSSSQAFTYLQGICIRCTNTCTRAHTYTSARQKVFKQRVECAGSQQDGLPVPIENASHTREQGDGGLAYPSPLTHMQHPQPPFYCADCMLLCLY